MQVKAVTFVEYKVPALTCIEKITAIKANISLVFMAIELLKVY